MCFYTAYRNVNTSTLQKVSATSLKGNREQAYLHCFFWGKTTKKKKKAVIVFAFFFEKSP